MFHKFLNKKTNTIFYYDNVYNGLYNADMKPITAPHGLTDDLINFIHTRNADKNKIITKVNDPVMIKVILGHRCNYSCGYCMQDELSDKMDGFRRAIEKAKISKLITSIRENIDTHRLERVELWGGEAFLYWAEVTALMEELDREGLTWYIPTNGTLIDFKHIDFFKKMKGNVCMGISHDGPAHDKTRGPNFLEKSVEVIRALQDAHPKIQFSFNPVISNQNYDLFAINDYFRKYIVENNLKNIPLMYEIIQVYNLEEVRGNSKSYAITGNDLKEYKRILTEYLEAHYIQATTLPPEKISQGDLLITNLYELFSGSISIAREMSKQTIMFAGTKCQADQAAQLSFDMDGNVRTCQNVGKEAIFGNINNIKDVGVTNIDTNQGPYCSSCRVRYLCKSQCPIKQHEDVFDTNCKINKVHYSAIQDAAFKYINKADIEYQGCVDAS